ncbi:hypothetical protein B0T14DRAFT_529203 [Immersiella caudata]|uniref:Kelch repeat-containing protein n=1 Tax=Immersiella caudata TaxID=314043 RepID=A0AA39TH65_9PEZI|nr:hypothetical protein B0T14DRAFT_529203 [Immersiella caudata]
MASLPFVLCKCLALLAIVRGAGAALFDVPTPQNYVRRSTAKATVLGNYVYIDGGEISQLDGGKIGSRTSNPVNSTLSIDISKSWTAESVVIRSILKPGPNKSNVHLFTDKEAGAFYSWGGKWIFGINMTETALWKFTADGNGGGTWSLEPPGNPSTFAELIPGEFAAVATAGDTGYLVGGAASGWTQLFRARNQVIPGMATFNMKTKLWQNGTTPSPFNTLIGGTAEFVPTFGPNGLIVVFGGWSPSVVGEADVMASPQWGFDNLTFFDPETKKNYWQKATGDIPPHPRTGFCTVGFQREGGYDIFLYGGMNQQERSAYNDAYILSLPGFVWTKVAESPGGRRAEQTCVPVGKRQVLSIGGLNPYLNAWTTQDPFAQGLAVFDMVDLKWTDSYNAGAAAYEAPPPVKEWYSKGLLGSVTWSSDDVQRLFSTATDDTPGGNGNNGNGGSNDPGSTEEKSTPVAAIAGGVVGGVVALAAIGALVWFLRRKKRSQDIGPMSTAPAHNELSGGRPSEMSPHTKYTPAPPYHEADSHDHHELYSQGAASPLPPKTLPGHSVGQYAELYTPAQTGHAVELDASMPQRR